jgi:GT2 family glycosyltransferase
MSSNSQGALRVLTVHFNTPELTARVIRDFPNQTPSGRDVFIHILDNRSTVDNLRALEANIKGLPNVTLQANDTNVGFGAGHNILANSDVVEESDILWFLNSDTRLQPGCLERIEQEIDKGDFAIVSPLVYSGEDGEDFIWYCGGSISLRELRVHHHLHGAPLSQAPEEPFETGFITGTSPVMRASTFQAIGCFPRGYFIYWEDTYMSWKAAQLGLRLGVVPAARLWHEVGGSSGSGRSSTFYYWGTRNRFAFAQDIGVLRRRLVVGRGGIETLRPLGWALLTERTRRLSKARAAVKGTIHGLRNPHFSAEATK